VDENIPEKIQQIRERIAFFENRYQRSPNSVKLLAVSKTQSTGKIRLALAAAQHAFAENYLQEALEKITALAQENIEWHFIGPIQSNKTRAIAEHFDWVHSVDRLKIATRLNEQRPVALPRLKVLIQVNLDQEASKSGVNLDELLPLARTINVLDRLELVGLMAIPTPGKDFQAQREGFRQLRLARDQLIAAGLDQCQDLSMGMSADYEAAIAEGATLIRIGTDIFGPRNP
jgi:pyridoxal phosphate enzyme (YggS family)